MSGDPRAGQLLTQALHDEGLEPAQDAGLLRRLLPYLRPHAPLLGLALLLMPLTSFASLLQPYLIKRAIDATLVDRSAAALMQVVTWFAAAVVAEFVTRFVQMYSLQLAGQRTMGDLRRQLFRHIQGLRVSYFDRTPVGRVVTRVTNDVDTLSEFFASGAVAAVADVLMLVGIVGFMLYLDWELSLIAFAALPPLAFVVSVFRRYARSAFREIRARVAQLNAYTNEQVDGISVVQAFGKEEACAQEYGTINDAYRDANLRAIRYDALLYSIVEAVSVASIAVVLWYASVQLGWVQDSEASAAYVGTVVAFYEYIHRFFVPIRDLATKYSVIQRALASAERIFALLDVDERDAPAPREPEQDDSGAVAERGSPPPERGPRPGEIELEHVTFAYRSGHPVLHDVSLTVRPGEKVALVGATGAGKTTVTALALRLHDVEHGVVRIDGRDVRSWPRHALRRRFAVVPQDVFLFRGTILANIALGDPSPDAERVWTVVRRVGAEWLVRRRGGLEAHVEDRGANFSAGERQLLAFARALYRDAPFVILDEATSHVDSESEAALQAAVEQVLEGRTALVIAHRLSTIRHADRIVVFHHGRLVEQGTHRSLLQRDGVYARLYRLQFAEEALVQ